MPKVFHFWQCINYCLFCIQQMADIMGNGSLCMWLCYSNTRVAAVASSHFSSKLNHFPECFNTDRSNLLKLFYWEELTRLEIAHGRTVCIVHKLNTEEGRNFIKSNTQILTEKTVPFYLGVLVWLFCFSEHFMVATKTQIPFNK